MELERLSAADLTAVLPVIDDIRHDLGKYVCLETRFVGTDGDLDDLRQALKADTLCTRKRADLVEPAWVLWARLRPQQLDGDPDLGVIDDAVAQLAQADLGGERAALLKVAAQAQRLQAATRRLAHRARQAAQAWGLDPDEL